MLNSFWCLPFTAPSTVVDYFPNTPLMWVYVNLDLRTPPDLLIENHLKNASCYASRRNLIANLVATARKPPYIKYAEINNESWINTGFETLR